MNLNIDNWVKLLSITQLVLFLKYRKLIKKFINIDSLNKKALDKIELFKKHKKKIF